MKATRQLHHSPWQTALGCKLSRFTALLLLAIAVGPGPRANAQILVEDWGYRRVREYSAAGGVLNPNLVSFPAGSAGPVGLALDGINLYAGDGNNGVVRKYTTFGATVSLNFITGLGHPYNVLCDGNGRLYVSDALNTQVGVYDAATGAPLNASFITAYSSPGAMALDGNGDLFVTFADGTLRGFNATTGTPLSTPIISGLSNPRGLACDHQGHLFVGSWDQGTVGEYTTSGGTVDPALITGFTHVSDMTFDAAGYLYVADWGTGRLSEYTASGQVVNPSLISLSGYMSSVVIMPEPSTLALGLVAGVVLWRQRVGRNTQQHE